MADQWNSQFTDSYCTINVIALTAKKNAETRMEGSRHPRLPARVTDHRFEGGDYLLTLEIKDLGEAGRIDARRTAPLTPGTLVELALTGGWILPRKATP